MSEHNRRTFIASVAAAPLASLPVLGASLPVPAELAALGERLIAANCAYHLAANATREADAQIEAWKDANPYPQLPADMDDRDERWPDAIAAYEQAAQSRTADMMNAMRRLKLAPAKEAAASALEALRDAAHDVAAFDAETLPALVAKAQLADQADCEGIVARSIVLDLLMMKGAGA